jgi:hypothetical protein
MANTRINPSQSTDPEDLTGEAIPEKQVAVDEPVASKAPTYIGDEPMNVPVNGAFTRVNTGDPCPAPPGDWPGLNPSIWKA